jgi:prepilin-type N-terminal cleavage/methylation domain-containing protein
MTLAPSTTRRGHVRGFTLIELLVVIAIIGILSAVVLAALNTARSKGNDASIKSNLDTIRTQSAIYYDSNNNAYGTNAAAAGPAVGNATCALSTTLFNDPNIQAAIQSADKAAGGTGSPTTKVQCAEAINSAAWQVSAPLYNVGAGTNWCVDSTGFSGATSTPTATTYH